MALDGKFLADKEEMAAAMVGNEAIVTRCLGKIVPGYEAIICFSCCKQLNWSEGRSKNKDGMLVMFQDQVKYSWSDLIHKTLSQVSHT